MKIEHIAIWVNNLEEMKSFYVKYFQGTAGLKYYNAQKNFSSYFISFQDGCRLELMHRPDIKKKNAYDLSEREGLIHFAMSVGSKKHVDNLTERLRTDQYKIIGDPRTTGDGYYESVILDPENNRIEITK